MSKVIPSKYRESSTGKENLWSVVPKTIAWCLSRFAIMPFSVYHATGLQFGPDEVFFKGSKDPHPSHRVVCHQRRREY